MFLQLSVDAERIVIVQMRFEEGDREGGGESAQTAADGRPVTINLHFDEFPATRTLDQIGRLHCLFCAAMSMAMLLPVLVNGWIRSELVKIVENFVAGHLDVVNCKAINRYITYSINKCINY